MDALLNGSQARSVYDAMCHLNNVSAKLDATFGNPDNGVRVYEDKWGKPFVWVFEMRHGVVVGQERHDSQAAFAKAYGVGE